MGVHGFLGWRRGRLIRIFGLLLVVVVLVWSVLVAVSPSEAAIGPKSFLNLGVSTEYAIPTVSGDLVFIPVSESGSGYEDLNGDGDTSDDVAHVYDPATGVTSLGIALDSMAPYAVPVDNGFVFLAGETDHGRTDLNADGDVEDRVTHTYTRDTGATNLGVAGWPVSNGTQVALGVYEQQQGGTDLNGDGDSDDRVVHVWSIADGLVNTATATCPPSWPIVAFTGGFAFSVGEDHSECVLHVYEPGSGVTSLDVPIEDRVMPWAAPAAGGFGVVVSESGGSPPTDLNRDGDTGDQVAHFYRSESGLRNLELAAEWVAPGDATMAIGVTEAGQGRTDLNGDGDLHDVVVHAFDQDDGVTNLALYAFSANWVTPMPTGFGFYTSEQEQGSIDLNADGDADDSVLHVYDRVAGLANVRLAVSGLHAGGAQLVAEVHERSQGNTDLNGDGDLDDSILHVVSVDGAATNLGVELTDPILASFEDSPVFALYEGGSSQIEDYNGDGDFGDYVAHTYDPNSGLVNLTLATGSWRFESSGTTLAVAVRETGYGDGTDLNGDGDTHDDVVHVSIPEARRPVADVDAAVSCEDITISWSAANVDGWHIEIGYPPHYLYWTSLRQPSGWVRFGEPWLYGTYTVALYDERDDLVPGSEQVFELDQPSGCGYANVMIAGGTAVVSGQVETDLGGLSRSVTRLAGRDRYATAAEISKTHFPQLSDEGQPVFIATGENFPDALAGGPAAASIGGPILLVQKNAIPSVTAAELRRINPVWIMVLGGTAVVSEAVEDQLAAYTQGEVYRIAGRNRYDTAAWISWVAFDPGVDAAYVATGANFPDALAGGPAAATREAPILLVRKTSIPGETAEELRRLNPKRIYILGGTAVVSSGVASQLHSYTSGPVTRLAGPDRYATAAAVCADTFGSGPVPSMAYIATGQNFPDGLTAGPVAGIGGSPILLVNRDTIPTSTKTELQHLAN